MNKMEYAQKVAKLIEDAEVKEVTKANGIICVGITKKVGKVSPIVYIDKLFEDNVPDYRAAVYVEETFDNTQPQFDLDFLNDYEKVKPYLRARLYNNKTDAEVFISAAAFGFDDLRIIPYIKMPNTENGYIKVTAALAEKWDMSNPEIIDEALENSAKEIKIQTLGEMMNELMGSDMFSGDSFSVYVVTNTEKCFGAISAITAMEKIAKMFPEGYVVLPSSVHEVLVLSADMSENDPLTQMVREVNESNVLPEEQLGDKAYRFA